jgi:hypothetical protein
MAQLEANPLAVFELVLDGVAVVGVSRSSDQPANLIYRKLRDGKRHVFAVNPNAESLEGGPCFPSVGAIPGVCPMMNCEPVDPGHKCIRFLSRLTGKLPFPLGAEGA